MKLEKFVTEIMKGVKTLEKHLPPKWFVFSLFIFFSAIPVGLIQVGWGICILIHIALYPTKNITLVMNLFNITAVLSFVMLGYALHVAVLVSGKKRKGGEAKK